MARLPRALFCDRVAHCFIHAVDGVWFGQRDHVEKLLLKGEPVDKAASEREVDPFSLSEESVAATDKVRTRTANRRQNLLADLMAMGVTYSMIIPASTASRRTFGLTCLSHVPNRWQLRSTPLDRRRR